MPLLTLYDKHIDRPKLTEQKEPMSVYSPPTLPELGQKNEVRHQKDLSRIMIRGVCLALTTLCMYLKHFNFP